MAIYYLTLGRSEVTGRGPEQHICAVDHPSNQKAIALLRRKAFTLDYSLPASELLQSLQKLTHLVYLTKLDAGDKVKVRNYMTDAEGELTRLKGFCDKARAAELDSTDQLEFHREVQSNNSD